MSAKIQPWKNEEEFISKYQELKSSRKMGEYFNCSKSTILRYAKEINFDTKSVQTYKLSQEDKREILAAYGTKITSTQLAEKYNVSRGMITKLWYDANLTGKQKTVTKYDLTGQKINHLTVLEKTDNRDTSGNIKWLCKCDCGNLTEVSSTRLVSGEAKSCGCLNKQALEKGRGSNFQDLTGQKFGELTVLERCENKEFENGVLAVQWLCQCSCGNKTKVLASNLRTGNTQSCGLCQNNSHGNIKINQILTEANIPFEKEKRFNTCKDKSYLPFDFYVDNRYLIEYDGKQHFKENGLFNYESTHKHDIIKSQWCKANNIPLIRIPYTHYDNLSLKDLILETSSFVEK